MQERCIFVVDDDQGVQDAFDAMLGDEYHVHFESNGIDALKSIFDKKPQLIFLDIKLSGINGIEVLKWIKWNKINTKIFLITALPHPIYKTMAEEFGVGFIKKPFEVNDIESIASESLH
jgi:DNA-binding NtrC family response regulator